MSTNILTSSQSAIYSPITYRLNLKRAMVNSLRSVFNTNYPDQTLRNTFISMEWPDLPEQYSCMLVTYTETSLRNAGIGHFGALRNGRIFKRWLYDGTIQVNIIADTAMKREFVADHFVNMFAFGALSPYGEQFLQYFSWNKGLQVNVHKEVLVPLASTAEKGSSWGLEDITFYATGYQFGVSGSFTSEIRDYGLVRGVNPNYRIG